MPPRKSVQPIQIKPVRATSSGPPSPVKGVFPKPPVAVVAPTSFLQPIQSLWSSYLTNTSKQLKLIDALQLFLMLTGIAQFAYCVLVTNFPFNAFLGGFSATVGQFVLSASLRSQVNPQNKLTFAGISPERAFADFIFASMVLHFFVFNYLG